MANLPVDFVDAILASSMNGKRRVRLTEVSTGVYEIEDVTVYDQEGSTYGANQVNSVGVAVNGKPDTAAILDTWAAVQVATQPGIPAGALALKDAINSNLANNGKHFKFGYNSATDTWGYIKDGADTVTPFSGKTILIYAKNTGSCYEGHALDVRNKTKLTINASVLVSSLRVCSVASLDTDPFNNNNDYGTLIQNITTIGSDVVIDISSYDYITLRFYNANETNIKYYLSSGKVTITIE